MTALNIRFLTVLTSLTLLAFSVCALAAKPDKCGDGICRGNETPTSCEADCGGDGGGDDGGLGSAIPMECLLGASWGDGSADTIKDDKLGWYEDAVDRAECTVSGPSIPWPIYLRVWKNKGKPPSQERKVDIVLDDFVAGSYKVFDPLWSVGTHWLKDLYPDLFSAASGDGSPNMDEMDALRFAVRPYRGDPILGDPTQTTESIHRLPWQIEPYEMGMHLGIPYTDVDRFVISIASKHYAGNEGFTGISCQSGNEAEILTRSPEQDGDMRDVSVYLWRDADEDGLPDGYTVTTGQMEGITAALDGPPDVTPGPRWAAVCSAVGPETCGNPKAPSNCNFLGYVKMQFTLHACASDLCEGYGY